jgi:hypothetical protein
VISILTEHQIAPIGVEIKTVSPLETVFIVAKAGKGITKMPEPFANGNIIMQV